MPAPNGTHTNGIANGRTNGASYSSKPGRADSLPATSIIAEFVASASPSLLTEAMRTKLSDLILDFIGITAAAAQSSASTPSIVAAITSFNPTASGPCTVLSKGSGYPPHIAALLNATFDHSLDFDDTHAASTLHPGVTAIAAALAQAEALPSAPSNDLLLLAISVGYEITCRLGTELDYAAYSRGFHNTSTAGIFGAVGAIAVLKGLDQHTVEMAFGLAGSRASGSMQYLDNGSHNKRLHPGFAVHDAFFCIALAEAGVIGATRIFEGKMGFLNAYSPSESKDLFRLTEKLGEEWKFVETSLKPYPACRMTHGPIELADQVATKRREEGKEVDGSEVKRVDIQLKTANMSLVGDRTPNKVHPMAEVDAQFSAYFQVAHAYLFGADQGVKAYTRLDDKGIHDLSSKIFCDVDDDDPQLQGMGSKIRWSFEDADPVEVACRYPLGEPEHVFSRTQIEKKFLGCAEPVYGKKKADAVLAAVSGLCGAGGKTNVQSLMKLVA